MTYVIQPGDTIRTVARKFGISEKAIIKANRSIKDPNVLLVGDVISIPVDRQQQMEGNFPEVVANVEDQMLQGDDIQELFPGFQDEIMDGMVQQMDGMDTQVPATGGEACPTLRVGSRGPAVVRLQTLLNTNGFNVGTVDGIFGSRTLAAVQAFQASRGLTVDGIVGVRTWTALGVNCAGPGPTPPPTNNCPTLRVGSRGTAVTRLQRLLTDNGFPATIDGIFGPRTEAAVRAFQTSRGLAVTGIVDIRTWTALGVNCVGPTPPPPTPGACPTLSIGSRGAAVVRLQQLLTNAGFPLVADGVFGTRTQGAVIAFQRSRNLPATGVVNVATWQALGVNCMTPPPPPPPVDNCPRLARGSRGPAVSRLQQLLNQRGFGPGVVTGFFGPRTEAAVRAFQAFDRIPVTGIVDVTTWVALGVNCQPIPSNCPRLAIGSRGPAVVQLQTILNRIGFNVGAQDGVFGPRTEAGVRAFQSSRGLPVTGVVDVATWTALGVMCM